MVERGQLTKDGGEDFLADVSGIRRLEARQPAPTIHERSVQAHQAFPGSWLESLGPLKESE
jgi:hypothetical protein